MTDNERIEMIEDQLELMESVCKSFAEVDDIENCRAIYEEYAEWFDSLNDTKKSEDCYISMWAPNFLEELK